MNKLEELERVASSAAFSGADALRNVLVYLGERGLRSPSLTIKEYEIATEALGRGADFDSLTDSSVRVTMNRLRGRLAEYYKTEGADDPCVIEIPKGSYRVLFRDRQEINDWKKSRDGSGERDVRRQVAIAGLSIPAAATALVLIALVSGGIGYRLRTLAPPAYETQVAPISLSTFWTNFLEGADAPMVIYSNAPFVGNGGTTGLFYFDPATHSQGDVVYTYTGVGEVMAVHALSETFGRLGRRINVRRGELLGWDEAKRTNLIFVGGPAENLPVRELRELRDEGEFTFRSLDQPIESYGAVVVNRRPRPGEPEVFDASQTALGRRDYALIRLLPGFTPGRHILILAGVTTQGTQAASEFVCNPEKLEALLSTLGVTADQPPRAFECVLEVDLQRRVPIDSRVVAVRGGNT